MLCRLVSVAVVICLSSGVMAQSVVDPNLFGSGFGVVTDMFSGPGGMYVLSLTNDVMYRITTATPGGAVGIVSVPEPPPVVLLAMAGAFACRRAKRRAL